MHKNLKNEKGITLVSLVVTIVVMMILVISITSSLSTTTELKRFNEVKEDIVTLTEEVKVYYLNNGTLPIDTSTKITLNISSDLKNVNDGGNYYPIKTDLLDVELNNGEGNKQNNYTTTDLYVVDDVSLTVYYVNGITINGITYYTLTDDFVAGNYYTKTNLPIVASVTMQSNGANKNKAAVGDKVTLRIITNYELTQTPTVKINNTVVTVTWNGTIGTASYVIPADSGLAEGDKIAVNISSQQADGRVEGAITDVTFGKGVYYYVADSIVEGVTIPAGFVYVGGTKDSGLVISDSTADKEKYKGQTTVGTDLEGNQFVWIPVDNITDYKRTAYSSQVASGTTDTATNSEQIKSSSSSSYYYTEALPADEKTSVETNKGFYIGRYEAGDQESTNSKTLRTSSSSTSNTITVKAGQAPYNYIKQTQAKSLAEAFSTKQGYTSVTSKLTSSYAWDTAIAFIQKTNSDYGNSSEEGNYKDSPTFTYTGIADTEKNKQTKANGTSTLIPTGQTTAVNNIYDMGGNVWEWTTESYSSAGSPSSLRGGSYLGNFANLPAGYRDYYSDYSNDHVGFRCTLYL